MIITPSYVYLHLPKTGGFWVRDAIRASGTPNYVGPMHVPADQLLPAVGDRYSFTFVRHPLTWWRSFWAHSSARGWPSSLEPFHNVINCCVWYSYQEFMTKVLNDIPGEYTRIVGRYTDGVTRVGLFENLAADLLRLTTEAGHPASIDCAPNNPGNYDADRSASTPEIDAEIMRTEAEVIHTYYGG
jgi:hypothetical protein